MDHTRSNAVSPVVGVILMVAITVILSAVIGTFVLNLGQKTTSTTAGENAVTITENGNGSVDIQVISMSAEKLTVKSNGSVVATLQSVGSTATIQLSTGDQLVVLANGSQSKTVVQTYQYSSSTVSSKVYSVPTSGLIAHWELNEASGATTAVEEVNGYNGSVDTYAYPGKSGINGSSYYFENSTGGVDLSEFHSFGTNITVTYWINLNEQNNQAAIYTGSLGETGSGTTSNGKIKANVKTSSWAVVTGPNATVGSWTHVAYTYDGSYIRLYVNGTLVNKTTQTGPLNQVSQSNYPPSIGGLNTSSTPKDYHGQIDSVRMYKTALNESQVNRIYQSEKP